MSVRPNERPNKRTSEQTKERMNERTSVRGPMVQPPPQPQPLGLVQAPAPRPLETLPRPQLPCSRPPATPPFSRRPRLPLESPCPPRTDGKFTPLSYRILSPLDPPLHTFQVPKMCTARHRVLLTITGPRPSFFKY